MFYTVVYEKTDAENKKMSQPTLLLEKGQKDNEASTMTTKTMMKILFM
jgi:hypothetical protein